MLCFFLSTRCHLVFLNKSHIALCWLSNNSALLLIVICRFPYLKGVNWTLLPMPSVCLSVHLFVCILLQGHTSPAVRDSKLKYSQVLCCLGMKQANIKKKTSQVKVDLTWRGFRLSNEELCCPPRLHYQISFAVTVI